MRQKLFILLLLLFLSNDFVFGKNRNKTKSIKHVNKNHNKENNHYTQKENKTRLKRSLDDEIEKFFVPGKAVTLYDHNVKERGRTFKLKPVVENDPPFWGTRGRRDSASDETVPDVQLPDSHHHKNSNTIKNIQKLLLTLDDKQRRDEVESPFWGNRGRRDSDESEENDIDLFWANRGRRQDEEPFWGTRGRREEDSPFWGNRGRRDDDEPFWGNRGRREEPEPFWGNRGRRQTFDPFWGTRGKKKIKDRFNSRDEFESFRANRAKLKEKLKDYIIETLENVDNMNVIATNKRNRIPTPFWMSRGRESKLKYLFNRINRNRLQNLPNVVNKIASKEERYSRHEPNTVNDDRIYAEEPRYILVERNSRSSLEDDPFFITRGKKYSDFELEQATRGRRGALEEIVKSVRNDPYFIARGKKDPAITKIANSSLSRDDQIKTKELVCATVDLVLMKHASGKVKREIKDNDRERRTILNKLAQQLQIDPYYVSRGKKNIESNAISDSLEQFINNIRVLCN